MARSAFMLWTRMPPTVSVVIEPTASWMIRVRLTSSITSLAIEVRSRRRTSLLEIELVRDGLDVHPAHDLVEIDARDDRVDVQTRNDLVDRDARDDGLQVDAFQDAVDVEPVHDGVEVHARDRAIQVHPLDDLTDVDPRGDEFVQIDLIERRIDGLRDQEPQEGGRGLLVPGPLLAPPRIQSREP